MQRLVFSIAFAVSLTFVSTTLAQRSAAPTSDGGNRRDMGDRLMQGLQEIDGCLAVKTCVWGDGKRSIVAWFEDKAAAEAWYYSDTHQGMIGNRTDGSMKDDEPMKHVADDQPMMVLATLTPADKPELPGVEIPISQISIELFAPLPGGAQIGGRVSPTSFQVPHMRDYTPASEEAVQRSEATRTSAR